MHELVCKMQMRNLNHCSAIFPTRRRLFHIFSWHRPNGAAEEKGKNQLNQEIVVPDRPICNRPILLPIKKSTSFKKTDRPLMNTPPRSIHFNQKNLSQQAEICALLVANKTYVSPDRGQWPCQSGCLSHVSIVNNRSLHHQRWPHFKHIVVPMQCSMCASEKG